MMHESIKAKSRRDWTNERSDLETLRTGCLMRIADATEKMAQRHTELINERDMYKRWYEQATAERRFLERRVAALKGQITKLKKQLKEPT